MKTLLLIGLTLAALAAPIASAECVDLAGNGEACVEQREDGADANVDARNDDAGVSIHAEAHVTVG